ncbi:cobaltochelatase subunit CobN [Sphingomonas yunnanensis]|uniref:cobaltochelatase subunit CobN n=1 Tax=Sphingomonas yunnanensis TaxID=310400 RepID=UPI001CA7447A|nr:cobaltochelatase subunit CobN [Sphingomonas yunnanensis]MBY9061652.1 cobaltochelatase subunit CobN [Sphingomonas yunnanensis]
MHVLFRETHGLDSAAAPRDLAQSPADLVVLSFSDSDLQAFAAGWHAAGASGSALPSLRLADLAELAHPLSVDTYVEATLLHARAILVRLIGGRSYWSYGLQQLTRLAQERGIALAVLAADGREDGALDAASTLPRVELRALARLCDSGGAEAARGALALLARAAGLDAVQPAEAPPLAAVGAWAKGAAPTCPAALAFAVERPRALIVFYRSYLLAGDVAPIAALREALAARGLPAVALFAPSLKEPEARRWLRRWVAVLAPEAIVSVTAFAAGNAEDLSPLDTAGAPVFQVALATSERRDWIEAVRGLSPADLAMHVVLPEVDGRIFAGVASFKDAGARDPALEFARRTHRPDVARVEAIADRVAGWVALGRTPRRQRRVALVLSTYPGKSYQHAHAVGLDPLASAEAMLSDLEDAGYDVAIGGISALCGVSHASARPSSVPRRTPGPGWDNRGDMIAAARNWAPASAGARVEEGAAPLPPNDPATSLTWPLPDYERALATLSRPLQDSLTATWGSPGDDPAVTDGHFHFAALERGNALVALQPERGDPRARGDEYHDVARVPRHAYVAFYLWLRARGSDAIVHVGAHGTLEWLPGKAVALSDECWPEALIGATPLIYPFIVNDPGEAAQAKRRAAAVTLGHLPPALARAEAGAGLARLELLLDEFSAADGLDPARRVRLAGDIADEAAATGLAAELDLAACPSDAERVTRIDTFVCDVKDSRFGDGLHVYGRGESGAAERDGWLAALDGRRVAAGPAGSPARGAAVLPTGRNLYGVDPRATPSRSAHRQGVALADELLRRHLQDEGDYPRALVVDLWGSATMRTAGEEFAMALHLLGAAPQWDHGSDRVSGVEILPLALLDRPRVDVTLRISGLFRDTFPTLCALFGQAVRALHARDEPSEMNPFAADVIEPRVYGPAPGGYGVGLGDSVERYDEEGRSAAGKRWFAASSHAYDDALEAPAGHGDAGGLRRRVAAAEALVHPHDLPESDLLTAADVAAHVGGFAAAKAALGGEARLLHLDSRDPAAPRARPIGEEIARVMRARAGNRRWLAGMMRHGYRGAAEIAATLDHLAAFAHLTRVVPTALLDLYHGATLGDAAVRDFLADANPAALAAMEARFRALHRSGLWPTRRNAIVAALGETA